MKTMCTIIFLLCFLLAACHHSASRDDIGRDGLGGVTFVKKDLPDKSFTLEAHVVPYLGESTHSLINRARSAADIYATDECKKLLCGIAAQLSSHYGAEAFASRTWIYIYKCYECK